MYSNYKLKNALNDGMLGILKYWAKLGLGLIGVDGMSIFGLNRSRDLKVKWAGARKKNILNTNEK